MINLGSIQLPITAATKTFAILAKKGAGKSYTAGVMEEGFYESGIPFVVFDPIDVHWGIRFNKDGKTAGYPVVVFGVLENADITLNENMGKQIAQAIVNKNISCIISTFGMSKKGMRKLITEFSEELLKINNTPRHIFIEEAHEFVPQRIGLDMGRCFSAVEALVVMGRNRGLGVTLINQRAATINKDVLTQIDTLMVFRNTSPHDRKALQEWVEAHGTEEDFNSFMSSLSDLPTGEGWIWSPEFLKKFERIKIRERKTLHPDRESLTGVVDFPQLKQTDIQDFISSFKDDFKEENISENWIGGKKNHVKIGMDFARGVDKAVATEYVTKEQYENDLAEKDKIINELNKQIKEFNEMINVIQLVLSKKFNFEDRIEEAGKKSTALDMWLKKLPGGAGNVLRFLADKYPMKFSRSQLALATGIKMKTLVNNQNYLMTLKRNNMIVETNGEISINTELL